MSDQQRSGGTRRLLRAFGPDLWAHRRALATAYVFSGLGVGAAVLSPWPLKVIIDQVVGTRPLPRWLQTVDPGPSPATLVVLLAGVFVFLILVGAVTATLERLSTARVRERLTLKLRDRLLGHLQLLPPTFRTANRSGELVLRLVGDVDLFVRLLTKTVPLLFRYAATGIFTLAAMWWIAPRAALASFFLVPALGVMVRHYGPILSRASRKKRRREGEVAGFAQEVVRGLPVIQALGEDHNARREFARLNTKSLGAGVELARVTSAIEQSLEVARGVAIALVTGVGALLVLKGRLTLGELTVLGAYIAQLLKPVDKINELAEATSRGLTGGERLLSLLDQTPLVLDAPDAVELGRTRGEIELCDVRFAYPDQDGRVVPVLCGVSMRLQPGQLTVLIGRSGAGKSTILNLLVRLFDPVSGTILLDGQPLPRITLRSLRAQIAIMTQDIHLFAGSLRDALAPAGFENRRLLEALDFVALGDFVRGLPSGLDTPLGEDGLNLSGGQRQRLSLARAFLLDRPILLLDEPLANVDATSAGVIQAALDRLRTGRTCLAITHQPALLEQADVVYRLEDGRVTEEPRRSPMPWSRVG